MKKVSINKYDFFGKVLFVLFAISWGYGEYINNVNDDFKYIFAIINILIIFFQLIINRNNIKECLFKSETKNVLFFSIAALIISLCFQLKNSNYSSLAWKEFFYFSFPVIYAFCLINNNKKDNLDFYFNILFIVFVISFFIKYGSLINLSNIQNISFNNSYSVFESAYSTIFVQFFIYYFIRKKKILYIISALLCILSLKRLDIIFLLIFPFLYKLYKDKGVSKKTTFFIKTFFVVSPFIMMFIYSNEFNEFVYNTFNLNLNQFTTGRYRLVNYVTGGNLVNNGLGTIEIFLKNLTGETNIHCDVIKIFFETTIIGSFLLSNCYFNVVKENKMLTFVLVYLFMILCLSHCLTSVIVWLLFFLNVGYYKSIILKEGKANEKS